METTKPLAIRPSSAPLWTGIFAQNRAAVLDALNLLCNRLNRFRAALEAGDTASLDTLLAQAKKVRDALGS